MALEDRLAARIHEDGPLRFSEWMEACLYDEEGYYMRPGRKTGPGDDADFVTPPTLHPFFATAIARKLQEIWEAQGKPSPFVVHEHGGGEGDLARGALAAWEAAPELGAAARWVHVERSPAHRAKMAASDPRIQVTDPEHPPADRPHVVLAIELLDAIPFDIYEVTDGQGPMARQVLVTHDGAFKETVGPEEPLALWGRHAQAPALAPGQRVLDQRQAQNWLEGAVDGSTADVLLVDYGDTAARLWTRARMDGSVRTYSKHSMDVSPYELPGEVDLTGSVDFDQVWGGPLFRQAEHARGGTLESLEQFLLDHGILEELNGIDRSTVEGASSYLRLRQLLLPTGLGAAFKVNHVPGAPEA